MNGKKEEKETHIIPSFEEIKQHILQMQYNINAEKFYKYYTSDPRGFPANWKYVLFSWNNKELKSKKNKKRAFSAVDPESVNKNTFGCGYIFSQKD